MIDGMWLVAWYPLLVPMVGALIIGILSGVVGTFALLREQTLMGDAIAHAALPGIIGMFMLTHATTPIILLSGGCIAGCIGMAGIFVVKRYTKIKYDAALGIILSVFFGFGLVLLTLVQKSSISQQSVLNKFLFGSAATQLSCDVMALAGISGVLLMILIVLWKELVLCTFDSLYAQTRGYPTAMLDVLVQGVTILTIVVGLYAVGVVLMSSMLVAPAVAARQWTRSPHTMAALSALFGAIAGICGVEISACVPHMPSGPCMVVVVSFIALISLGKSWIFSCFSQSLSVIDRGEKP